MLGCRPLSEEEWRGLCTAVNNPRDKLIILTGLSFGLRVSETLNLRFRNFQSDGGKTFLSVYSSKGSENTTFPVPQHYLDVMGEMKAWYLANNVLLKDDSHLFLSPKTGKVISRQRVDFFLRGIKKKLGLSGKVNTHSLRKTFVTRIYELTNDIIQTRKYSRHKNLNNLIYYVETTKELNLVEQVNIL